VTALVMARLMPGEPTAALPDHAGRETSADEPARGSR
jgi:hypothetical protein